MSMLKTLIEKGKATKEGGIITVVLSKITQVELSKLSQELFMTHMNVAAYLCPKNVMCWERIKK